MASITIRSLEEAVKTRLQLRAVRHGRSMEEEARQILKAGLATEGGAQANLAESIRRHLEPVGGIELMLPRREAVRRAPSLDE
jgi:plasmid stability protein